MNHRPVKAYGVTVVRVGALAAAAAAVTWSNVVLPSLGLDRRRRSIANAVFATGFAAAGACVAPRAADTAQRPANTAPRPASHLSNTAPRTALVRSPGVWWGIGLGGAVAAGYAGAAVVPTSRRALAARASGAPDWGWVLLDIPLGTVYSEELIFRGTVTPMLVAAFGTVPGRLLGALTFGLWHVRAASDGVAATVAFTSASGLLFDELAAVGGLAAPAALHLATNCGGAIATTVAAH